MTTTTSKLEQATFGGGCFWCTEAIFEELKGVTEVVSGYAGGEKENPTYHEVSSGQTKHAECIQITFDPSLISYETLLEIFFSAHDPTTPNKQGNDLGSQYRSIIIYHSREQRDSAEKYIKRLDEGKVYSAPIVTELKEFTEFTKAEDYHQNYFKENPNNPYCTLIISPKLDKLRKKFSDKVK